MDQHSKTFMFTLINTCFVFHLAWEEFPYSEKLIVISVKASPFPTITLCPENGSPDRWGPAIHVFDHLKRKCSSQR